MIVEVLDYIINLFIGILLADFIMGVYHWLKDTYFSPFTPIIGKTFIWNSRLHHVRPKYVTEFSDKSLFISSAKWTLIWVSPLIYLIGFTPFMISLYLTISLNDVIHKYAHLSDSERPNWATFLQKNYIFQSYDEHHLHHITPHEVNYCPITPYINILLEKANFWKYAESFIENYFGMKAREHEDVYVEDSDYPAGIKFINNK